eukprot:TCONS_00027039-protein
MNLSLVNQNVLNADYGGIPYQENIKNALKDRPEMIVKEQVIELMRNEIPPTWSKKYAHLHNAQWRDLVKIQKSCAVHFGERPTMVEVLHSLGKQEPESDCWACFKNSSLNEIVRKIEIISLPISQNSAMEHYNEEQALAFENTGLLSDQPLENDGSNGCTYLCLKIVQNLLKEEYTGEKLEEMVAKVIWTYPAILNNFRSFSSMSPMDAYKVMVANDKNFIKMNFEYVVGSYRALTDSGKADLHEKLNSLKEDFVSVFVCLPYTVVIFRSKGKLHLIDTHSIPEKSGGTGTGVIVSSETAQDLCNWLHLRLENTEMEVNTPQSLILLKENTDDIHFDLNMVDDDQPVIKIREPTGNLSKAAEPASSKSNEAHKTRNPSRVEKNFVNLTEDPDSSNSSKAEKTKNSSSDRSPLVNTFKESESTSSKPNETEKQGEFSGKKPSRKKRPSKNLSKTAGPSSSKSKKPRHPSSDRTNFVNLTEDPISSNSSKAEKTKNSSSDR